MKKHFKLILFFLVSLFPALVFSQSPILLKVDSTLKVIEQPDSSYLQEEISAFQSSIKDAIEYKDKKNFSGSAKFGFNGESTREKDDGLFAIYGGVDLNWDLYPGELDLSTHFGINFTDGEIRQNVSRIDISYDHTHKSIGNGTLLENYFYVNRSSDAYLGIDQRYEIGGGFIINNWIDKYLNKQNKTFQVGYHKKEDKSQWDGLASRYLSEDQQYSFNNDFKEAFNKYKKSNSKLRIALLAGAYFELEQTSVNDSITLDATNKFRWVIRPTVDIKLNDGWKMSFRPYFKMPMPWAWSETVTSSDGQTASKTDYSINFLGKVSTQLLSKRIEIGFIYNLAYDNSPPRVYYENGNNVELLINNDLHQSYRISVSVNLAQL